MFVLGIFVRDAKRTYSVLGRSTHCSRNDLSGVKCNIVGRLRLEASPSAGLGLQRGDAPPPLELSVKVKRYVVDRPSPSRVK